MDLFCLPTTNHDESPFLSSPSRHPLVTLSSPYHHRSPSLSLHTGGVSRFGKLLILYRDENMIQTFYQLSCKKDILNKPCKFLDKRYESRSVCTQRYGQLIIKINF